jgi:hypothetical protein
MRAPEDSTNQTLRDKYIPPAKVAMLCAGTKIAYRGCWEYETPRGGQANEPYIMICWRENGKLVSGKTSTLAARLWLLQGGEIKEGFEVHHICRNGRCHNPDHLQILTAEEHKAIHAADRDAAKFAREHADEIADELERKGFIHGVVIFTDNEEED